MPPAHSIRSLLTLAWPIVLARATQAVVGFTDALMVAPLGDDAIAAVTTGALDTMALLMLPLGTVFIIQTFSAQLRGRGDLASVRRYAWYGLLIALGSGVIGALAIPAVPYLLSGLPYTPQVVGPMATFIAIRLTGLAAIVGTEALGNWYGGLGNTRLSMVCGLTTMVANVVGNYLLIEPRFGLPGYGVAGSAWASTCASWLGFAVAALAFASGWGYERTPGPLRLRRAEFGRVMRFGLPNGANWFLEFAAFALFINVVVGHFGTTVLAAMNIVLQINSVSFMPAFGVASAGAILVGEAIGARRHDSVCALVRLTLAVACAWMLSAGLVYWCFPEQLLVHFRPNPSAADPLLAVGITMLSMAALWQVFDAVLMSFSEALRAAGDTAWCLKARIVIAWLVFTPAAWLLVFVLKAGVVTMMVCLTGYVVLLAAAFAWRFASGRWREIELLDALPSDALPTARD